MSTAGGGKQSEYEQFLSMEGPSIGLEVERSPLRVVSEPDRTFSEAAMEQLAKSVQLWIGTRVVRAISAGTLPKHLMVQVHVVIDGKEAE